MITMFYNSQKARDRQVTPQLTCSITTATQLSCTWLIHLVNISATGSHSVMNCTMHSHTEYSVLLCNTPKPIREVDMIIQQEQLAAAVTTKKVTTKAVAAAVEASTLVDLTFASSSNAIVLPSTEDLAEDVQDMSTFSPSEEVELAFTEEVLDLFSKYFDADSVDAESRNVVQDSINADLDFNNKVFEPNYACQPA